MTSLDVAGKCADETCCQANVPERKCRCFVSERLHQIARICERLPAGADDAMVHAVWKERLRALAFLSAEVEDEPLSSELWGSVDRVATAICEIQEGDSAREAPITREEWQTVAALEGWE